MSRALPLSMRLAARELRGGLAGFRIFIACLALGVAAIAAVGSMSASFVAGLAEEGQNLLGGDVEVQLTHRPIGEAERDWLAARAAVSQVAQMRAILRRGDGADQTLVELKGVDNAYPLYGTVALEGGGTLESALAGDGARPGVVIEDTLATRLDLAPGDPVRLGTLELVVGAILDSEPDRLSSGFALGPRVLVSMAALGETGLIQVGSLVEYAYRVRLAEGVTDAEVGAFVRSLRDRFPDAEWQVRDRRNSAQGLAGLIAQVGVFLTFVGLTALVVGGVGVGNAVVNYLDGKRETIATLKTIGAEGGLIFRLYLTQVLALALVGIAIGLVLGAAAPFLVERFFAELLPIPSKGGLYPFALALAALYGLLTALAFTVWPLARAREVPAASLFRDIVAPVRALPRRSYMMLAGVAFTALAATALLFTANRLFAAWFILGAVAVFLVLRVAGWALQKASKRLAAGRRADLRIALANLNRPGAPTPAVVLSLGLGLTLLVTVSLIDGNITAQVRDQLPESAPSFFFIDIQRDQLDAFVAMTEAETGISNLETVPNLRGRVVSLKGVPAAEAPVHPDGRWALRGDRGVTYETELPEGTTLIAGEWWPPDYAGPPLVSLEDELAREFGLTVGDTLTLNVLGREITFEVANLRRIDWNQIGINFLFIVSPGVLEAAPHMHLATLSAEPAIEAAFQRRVTEAFPNVTAVRVKEALATINALLEDLGLAVRVMSAVTLIAGVLVLAGALAAGRRQRTYDAVLLKVLGATRRRIIAMLAVEYALLGLATAVIAGIAGTLAAWFVVREAMEAPWVFLPLTVVATALAATLITAALGLAGTWHVLGQKAAPVLRRD